MTTQRGFSLVEALIGLLVLTVGLLAVLRAQPLLRQHAEAARQRSEAVRLVQEEIEQQRAAAAPAAGERLVDDALASTRYRLVREVDTTTWPNATVLDVTAQWPDRTGTIQQLRLATIIATPDPALPGAAVLPR